MRGRRKKRYRIRPGCFPLLVLVVILFLATVLFLKPESRSVAVEDPAGEESGIGFQSRLEEYAGEEGIPLSEWPEELIETAEKNPETEEFVLHYPQKKAMRQPIDLNAYRNTEEVPLFLQWDERWGYREYAGEVMGISGCGPTCLSMVSVYLLHNPKYNPRFVAEFSTKRGYFVNGKGSRWTLMTEGAEALGLKAYPIGLDESVIRDQLENHHPIICAMSPGHFTTTGHFIVLTDYQDGMIKVNDPFSRKRSDRRWHYSEISDQISGMWAYSV